MSDLSCVASADDRLSSGRFSLDPAPFLHMQEGVLGEKRAWYPLSAHALQIPHESHYKIINYIT